MTADIQPVPDIPALKIGGILVIGDLHIGVEAHLGAKGVHLTSRTGDMLDTVLRAAGDDIGRLIILGDVKDSVPGSTKQEYREIPEFFDRLLERFSEVEIVRGNHDTSIEEFVPGAVRIRPASGMTVGDVGLVHGHTWPSETVMSRRTLVMGHEHPAVLFRDGVGAHMSEPCWLKGRFADSDPSDRPRYGKLPESFVVVPAFNRLLGGSPVNETGTPMLGPVLNSGLADLGGAHVYLLDGVDLGRREDIMVTDRRFRRRNGSGDGPRGAGLRRPEPTPSAENCS